MDYKSNIWKLYLVKFFGSLELTIPIFVLFMLLNNLSMTEVMIIESIFMITVVLLEIPTGAFADRYGRKQSMAVSALLATLSFIIFGLGDSFIEFAIANILIGGCLAFYYGASSAFIYDTLVKLNKEKLFPKIVGRFSALSLFTWAGAGLLGGYLANFISYRTLFLITAGFFFLELIFVLTLYEPPIKKRSDYRDILKKGLTYSLNHRKIRNLIIYYGTFAAIGHVSWIIIQAFYGQNNYSVNIIAIAMFLYFAFAGLGQILSHRIIYRFSEKTLLYSLLFIAGISFIFIPFSNIYMSLFFISLMTFVCGVRDPFIDNEVQINTASNMRATVGSVMNMGKGLNYLIFAPLLGYIMDLYSVEVAFIIMGVIILVHFIFIIILFSKNKSNN